MKVLAGPRLELDPSGPAARLCERLAGADGEVVSLAALGLRNPYRPFSAAEIGALRTALRGETGTIGYVCLGAAAGSAAAAGGSAEVGPAGVPPVAPGAAPDGAAPSRAVAVADHVNLTWRSPLAGPNDEAVGPRFPSMDGIYDPEAVLALGPDFEGMIISRGVVAGVPDDRTPGGHEPDMAVRFGWAAVSAELVAPVIIAAHMGLRIAAIVLFTEARKA